MAEGKESLMDRFHNELTTALKASTTLVFVETSEWERLEGAITKAVAREKHEKQNDEERLFLSYSDLRGIRLWDGKEWCEDERIKRIRAIPEVPMKLMALRDEFSYPMVTLLDDQHLRLHNDSHSGRNAVVQLLRDLVRLKRDNSPQAMRKTFIVAGEFPNEVPEIAHEMVRLTMPLPDKEILTLTKEKVVAQMEISNSDVDDDEEVIRAALGLTVMEAEIAFSHAIASHGSLTQSSIPLIMRKKRDIISRSGALDYIEPKVKMEDVGGLNQLKYWLDKRRAAFSPLAEERGLPTPKGILLAGVPGCGKSLTAKAIGNEWSMPLVRFDLGAVFQSTVGSSEANIRNALKVAEAVSPCILWIDEIEKGLAGSGGSGNLDSGVGLRVFGTILTWMNDNEADVFVVATANNLVNLKQNSPELLRKGRFDEVFFIDLPDKHSRKDIFEIHLNKVKDVGEIDTDRLAEMTSEWSGSEIEAAVQDALFSAFSEKNRTLEQKDLMASIERCTPQAQSMKDAIQQMRDIADAIGQRASSGSKNPEGGGGNVY